MQSIDSFGRNFRAIREDSKLKQYQIAERLGMTSPAISMWENKGTKPRDKKTVEAICDLFGVSETDLFGYSDGYYARTRLGNVSKGEDKACCRFWLAADHRSSTRWRAMPSVRA